MTDPFFIECSIDADRRILRVRTAGPIDSMAFADECISFFKSISTPWQFDRLYDESASTGVVSYDALQRMALELDPLWANADTSIRVAVVNPSQLVSARMPLVSQMYKRPNHRVFRRLRRPKHGSMQTRAQTRAQAAPTMRV